MQKIFLAPQVYYQNLRDQPPTSFDVFQNLLPSRHGIVNNLLSNPVFNFRFMPLFVVKNLIIAFNPNSPKGNTSQEVPNFAHFLIPFRDSFPEQGLRPIESVVVAEPPNPPNLDAHPKTCI